jgi:hypothetical protein
VQELVEKFLEAYTCVGQVLRAGMILRSLELFERSQG